MDINEFCKRYKLGDYTFWRIAGISRNTIRAYRKGQNVSPKTRAKIECFMECFIENDLSWPSCKHNGFCRDSLEQERVKREQNHTIKIVLDYLRERGFECRSNN